MLSLAAGEVKPASAPRAPAVPVKVLAEEAGEFTSDFWNPAVRLG